MASDFEKTQRLQTFKCLRDTLCLVSHSCLLSKYMRLMINEGQLESPSKIKRIQKVLDLERDGRFPR